MSKKQTNSTTEVFESDYESLLLELRENYQKKLNEVKNEFNEKLKKRSYDALGSGFSDLLSERVILLKDFEQITKRLLTESGIASSNEKLIALNEWAKNGDKNDKVLGKTLFRQVIDEVEKINPELAKKTKVCENALESNYKNLEDYINNNSNKMKQSENETREEMKKVLVKLILEYNLELKKLRERFNLPPTKIESPFLGSEIQIKNEITLNNKQENKTEDFEEDLFDLPVFDNDDLN